MTNSPVRKRRVERQLPELVQTLRDEVEKLWEFGKLAFEEGRDEYLGEVAAKLRLLVCEPRQGRPLLLAIMDEFGIELGLTLGGPPGFEWEPGVKSGDVVPFRQWLDMLAFAADG
jgi:hypothetical protein